MEKTGKKLLLLCIRGSSLDQIQKWILAFRPKTLTASFVPIVAASALVYAQNAHLDWKIFFCALMSSLFIQIGTNLVNDASDFKKGADTEKRLGPQRVTQAGFFTARQVMWMGTLCFAIAVVFGIPLVIQGGFPIVVIGVLSVICGYAYTAGPFPLAYRGLGDLFVILFFGIVAVMGMNFLYTQKWTEEALVLGLQIGFLSTVLIAINNLRDRATDILVGKKTLAVRLGPDKARIEIALLIVIPFVLNFYWLQKGFYWVAIMPLAILPLGIQIIKKIYFHEPGVIYNQFLGQSAGLHLLFGILMSVGFILS